MFEKKRFKICIDVTFEIIEVRLLKKLQVNTFESHPWNIEILSTKVEYVALVQNTFKLENFHEFEC